MFGSTYYGSGYYGDRATAHGVPVPVRQSIGCGSYDVYILTRGGGQLVAAFPWTQLAWARVLDDTSEGSATATGYPASCCSDLSQVRPWQHELAIYRDGSLVWVGPIWEPKSPPPFTFSIAARDLTSWWDHRLIHNDLLYDIPTDLATIFQDISDDAMAPDPSPGLTVATTPTGVTAVLDILAVQHAMAGPKLRDIANIGIDWTTVGRDVIAGGAEIPTSSIGTFYDDHFATPPTPRLDGSVQANAWLVRGSGGGAAGDTIFGMATADPSIIDRDGLLESVDTVSTLQDNLSAQAAAQSRAALTSEVILVENCVLAPSAPFPIEVLIPGALCELALEQTCIPVFGPYRLYKVEGDAQAGGASGTDETITLTFQPVGTM